MAVQFQIPRKSQVPLYRSVAQTVCDAVADGRVQPGQKLPTHADLAQTLGISPLTVGRGYELLRLRGIVRQQRGSGTYLTDNAVNLIRHHDRRSIATLWIVVGETSLADCKRETLFIITDILEGVRETFGDSPLRVKYVVNLTATDFDGIDQDDAVFVMSPQSIDPEFVEQLLHNRIPIVESSDRVHLSNVPSVNYDRNQSAAPACRHLIECGYKRIGFFGLIESVIHTVPPKYAAYTREMHKAGLDIRAAHVRDVPAISGKAFIAARDLIDKGDFPDALFVDTDYKAIEAICAFKDEGIRVPEDLGIVSYDNVPEAAAFDPPLTTVAVPRREIGRRVAQMLFDWPRRGPLPQNIELKSRLIVRQSTCDLRSVASH